MIRFHAVGMVDRCLAARRRAMTVATLLCVVLVASRSTFAAALSELLAGSSITVGDCLFTDWQLVSLDATGASPNLGLVMVTPIANDLSAPGLQFLGSNQLRISQMNALDLVLKYRVQALPGGNTFEGHTVSISGITHSSAGGIGFISDSLSTGLGANLESAVAISDPANEVFQTGDASSFSPQSGVLVTTNIFLQGWALNHLVDLTIFNHRFLQTGPPVLEGDYNQNGVVDTADYTVWRNAVGAPAGTLSNDTSGMVIGDGQYDTWKSQFGATGSGSVASPTSATVPEPLTLWMLLAGLPCGAMYRCRHGREYKVAFRAKSP